LEPIDGLDSKNRRVQGRRVKRFAKRRSAFRPSPFFFAKPRVSITSSIERLGCCWLRRPGLGSWQGQFQGQSPHRLIAPQTSSGSSASMQIFVRPHAGSLPR
jgi:hypothetical protein